jgi:hypothetical protein
MTVAPPAAVAPPATIAPPPTLLLLELDAPPAAWLPPFPITVDEEPPRIVEPPRPDCPPAAFARPPSPASLEAGAVSEPLQPNAAMTSVATQTLFAGIAVIHTDNWMSATCRLGTINRNAASHPPADWLEFVPTATCDCSSCISSDPVTHIVAVARIGEIRRENRLLRWTCKKLVTRPHRLAK